MHVQYLYFVLDIVILLKCNDTNKFEATPIQIETVGTKITFNACSFEVFWTFIHFLQRTNFFFQIV